MKRLTSLAKKSILSVMIVLVLGLAVAFPTLSRADAGGAPRVTEVYVVPIGDCVAAVYVYYSNGDHTWYYTNICS